MLNPTLPRTTISVPRNGYRYALVAAFSLLLAACVDNRPYVWGSKLPPEAAESRPLAVGDKVQIVVFGQDAMSGEYEIRPSGEIVVPMIGSFAAAGRTSADM